MPKTYLNHGEPVSRKEAERLLLNPGVTITRADEL